MTTTLAVDYWLGGRSEPGGVPHHQLQPVSHPVRADRGPLTGASWTRRAGTRRIAGWRCWPPPGTRCNPVNAETVNYIIARSEILSTLGVALALVLFDRGGAARR